MVTRLYPLAGHVQVLPFYANTHTTTTVTGLQTTRFRLEARRLVRNACNASEHDAVIFTGSGVTGAVHKVPFFSFFFLFFLPHSLIESFSDWSGDIPGAQLVHELCVRELVAAGERVVVLVGPFEHHSNLLPWRDAGATVVRVPQDAAGAVDQAALAGLLQEVRQKPAVLVIGAFSAASNTTGVLVDTDAISVLLHTHDAIAVWDYATAGLVDNRV